MRPPFTREDLEHFLAEYGYTCNPEGLASPFPVDYISGTGSVAFFDVNANAVRRGNSSLWKLKSVEELAHGVNSKALDRHQLTPKISSWPNEKKMRYQLTFACREPGCHKTAVALCDARPGETAEQLRQRNPVFLELLCGDKHPGNYPALSAVSISETD